MARGQVLQVPSGGGVLVTPPANQEKQSFALLNPNDGVCYLALNRRADPNPASWDWKLPSQSYGSFPGPWESLGIYYVDQSGAGLQGELNLYELDSRFDIPDIHSIGRALQARSTTLDITAGVQPVVPPVGVSRLWTDATDVLHILRQNGTDRRVLDDETDPLDLNSLIRITATRATPANGSGMELVYDAALNAAWIQIFDRSTGTFKPLNISASTINLAPQTPGGLFLPASSILNAMLADSSVSTAKLQSNAATVISVGSSDGGVYTYSTINTWAALPGVTNPLPITTQGGWMKVSGMVCVTHTVQGAYVNLGFQIDGGAWNPFAMMQIPVANQYTTFAFSTYLGLSAAAHSIYLGWSTNTAGTMSRNAWYNSWNLLEVHR